MCCLVNRVVNACADIILSIVSELIAIFLVSLTVFLSLLILQSGVANAYAPL